MSNKKPMTLTSVKVQTDLFNDFKIECVKRKFSFQKLEFEAPNDSRAGPRPCYFV